jgi:transposase-like protein
MNTLRRCDGPEFKTMSFLDLPCPKTVRWTSKRKAFVVCAIAGGIITIAEAAKRYGMEPEEIIEWMARYRTDGVLGLQEGYVAARRARLAATC